MTFRICYEFFLISTLFITVNCKYCQATEYLILMFLDMRFHLKISLKN